MGVWKQSTGRSANFVCGERPQGCNFLPCPNLSLSPRGGGESQLPPWGFFLLSCIYFPTYKSWVVCGLQPANPQAATPNHNSSTSSGLIFKYKCGRDKTRTQPTWQAFQSSSFPAFYFSFIMATYTNACWNAPAAPCARRFCSLPRQEKND